MHVLRTLITTAATTALAGSGLLTLGGLTPASAGVAEQQELRSNECVEVRGAIGCFYSYGDHIVVHDDDADGRRPEVQWETDYGRGGTCVWKGTSYWTDCNYNFREGSLVSFRVLQRSVSTGQIVDGTGWVGAYA